MDQIASAYDFGETTERARQLGYDREAIAFLGISQLKGVGFQTLSGFGGRADVAKALETQSIPDIAKKVSQPPGTGEAGRWEDFWRMIWTLGQDAARPLIERGVRLLFSDDPDFPRSLAAVPEELRPRWIFAAGNLELLERPSLAALIHGHSRDSLAGVA